jgi:hypothetical protein
MNKKTKIITISAIVVVVAIFAIWVCVTRKDKSDAAATAEQTNGTPSEGTSTSSTDAIATSTTSTVSNTKTNTYTRTNGDAVSQSYTDALKVYSASGYRMQFVNCQATPGQLTIKKGQKFMIDNRDSKPHKFKVGPTSYSVKGYGFAIATSKTLGVNFITCDGGGAAKINVEP